MQSLIDRLLRRKPATVPHPGPQGEEHEIIVQQREAFEEQERFLARLQRHSGNLDAPFLQDPFDEEPKRG